MGGAKTVCIVDDDHAVRKSLAVLLSTRNLTTICFSSAEEFLESEGQKVAGCLVVDLRLPGMNGAKLVRALYDAGENRPAIIVSGNADSDMLDDVIHLDHVTFMQKPFSPRQFVDVVEASFSTSAA